jgi:hypothetical protein
MSLVVAAAAAGLFGAGVLSSVSLSDNPQVLVNYERFSRYLSPTSMTVRTRADSARGEVHIRINKRFFEEMKIEKVVPEPVTVVIEDEWLNYGFQLNAPGDAVIRFDLMPQTVGRLNGAIRADTGPAISFTQFVYP